MHITSTRGAHTVAHENDTYEPKQGFVFDLPYELANTLLRMRDVNGPLWRLPEQDDYDLPEQIAAPPPDGKPKRTAPKRTSKPAVGGIPPVTGE